MAVVLTPADTATFLFGTEQIDCQVVAHDLGDADPTGGETKRTACGDVVNIPADEGNVGTLKLTLFPERGPDAFVAWTWQPDVTGTQVTFEIHINPGEPTEAVWAGSVTVLAINEKQDEYTKIETVDIEWPVTEWTQRAAAPAGP